MYSLKDVSSMPSRFLGVMNEVCLNMKFRYCPKDKAQNINSEDRKENDKEKGVEFHY